MERDTKQEQWTMFLYENFRVIYTTLNLNDLMLMELLCKSIITEHEKQILISEKTQIKRALEFIEVLKSDAARFYQPKLDELITVFEGHKCITVAALFREHAESIQAGTAGTNETNRLQIQPSDLCADCRLKLFPSIQSSIQPSTSPTTTTVVPVSPSPVKIKTSIEASTALRRSLDDILDMLGSNPDAISQALPEALEQHYDGKDATLDRLLSFIENLPTLEYQIIGFSAMYEDIQCYDTLPSIPQLVRLAKNVKLLNDALLASTPEQEKVGACWRTKLASLFHELYALSLIGEKATGYFRNTFYRNNRTLNHTCDKDWPKALYFFGFSGNGQELQIYPKLNKGHKLVFRIRSFDGDPIYGCSKNTNPNNRYETKASERHVLTDRIGNVPADAELDWKLEPVENTTDQFRILTATSNDFMFVQPNEADFSKGQRVLLRRKVFAESDPVAGADRWTIECSPGDYEILDCESN